MSGKHRTHARLAAGLLGLCLAWPASASADADPASEFAITNLAGFWSIPESLKDRENPVRLRAVVFLYDPLWRVLWLKQESDAAYLSPGNDPLPIKTGQEIELEGVTISGQKKLAWEKTTIRVLRDNALPEPVDWKLALAEPGSYPGSQLVRRVIVEGYVRKQKEPDADHLEFELVTERFPIQTEVLLKEVDPVPSLEECRVRVVGMLDAERKTEGRLAKTALWVTSAKDITILGDMRSEARFSMPSTPINKLLAAPANQMVRIEGRVRGQLSGQSLVIGDETGQVVAETWQTRPVPTGATVAVIGFPQGQGTQLRLTGALFREATGATNQAQRPAGLSKLRRVDQVKTLKTEEANKAYPVEIQGVVTWLHSRGEGFYLQDTTAGIFVRKPLKDTKLNVGDLVDVEGRTETRRLSPVIGQAKVTFNRQGNLPADRFVSRAQAMIPSEDSRWVALRGYVRKVTPGQTLTTIELATSDGMFKAMVPAGKVGDPPRLHSVVVARGVISSRSGDRRTLTAGLNLLVPEGKFLQVEEAAVADPFSLPLQPLAAVHQSQPAELRRFHVRGTVTMHRPGRFFYLQEGNDGLRVLSSRLKPLRPGTIVEVVGFPGIEARSMVMRDVVAREQGTMSLPSPLELREPNLLNQDFDARLVQVEGVLLSKNIIEGKENDERVMHCKLHSGDQVFDAWAHPEDDQEIQLPHGSHLRLTGTYRAYYDAYGALDGFGLELGSFDNLAVLEYPSWWTARRAITVAGGLLTAAALGAIWGLLLRRQVRRQTAVIRTQLAELERAKTTAEASARVKSEFVANMSHEIRTPMNAILGFADILNSEERDPTLRDYVRSIQSAGQVLLRLINDVLDLSKLESGWMELEYTTVDPRAVITQIRQAFAHLCAQKGIALNIEIEAPLPGCLRLDEIRFRQVLFNLVGNAVKFTHQGGVTIRAAHRPAEGDGEIELVVAVRDTGIGIDPGQQESVFQAFQQQHGQSAAQYGGTGLGLAISRRLVAMMGGQIAVRSEPGKGSEFSVVLPRVKVAAAAEPATALVEPAETRVFDPARVLIADDVATNRALLAAYLKNSGLVCEEAADGAEALAHVKEHRPDLILMDLKMPVMDGLEAAHRLRGDPAYQSIRLIAVTASVTSDTDPRLAEPVWDGRLLKPVSKALLLRELARHLPGHARAAAEEATSKPWRQCEETVPAEARRQWTELAAQLRAQYEPEWRQLQQRLYVNRVAAFAGRLRTLAQTYEARRLGAWAEELQRQADTFDLNNLRATLAEFSPLVEHCEAMAKMK